MTALAIPMITFLPVFAKNVFHKSEMTYTLFLVTSGLGSITGALTVAALGNIANKGRIALVHAHGARRGHRRDFPFRNRCR